MKRNEDLLAYKRTQSDGCAAEAPQVPAKSLLCRETWRIHMCCVPEARCGMVCFVFFFFFSCTEGSHRLGALIAVAAGAAEAAGQRPRLHQPPHLHAGDDVSRAHVRLVLMENRALPVHALAPWMLQLCECDISSI